MPTIKLATKDDIQAMDNAKSNIDHGHTAEEIGALSTIGGSLTGPITSDLHVTGEVHVSGKINAAGLNIGSSEIGFLSSYMAFVGNVNQDMVDAAFGKNNEDSVTGIGKALAMYAKYKGETSSFNNLMTCSTMADIDANNAASIEMLASNAIMELYSTTSHFLDSTILRMLDRNIKQIKAAMDYVIANPSFVDGIRDDPEKRAKFNRNRIRLLAPGDVSWTVPDDWPTDFIHVQIVSGGSGKYNCGGYEQFTLNVQPGDVITGNIGAPGTNSIGSGNQVPGAITTASGGPVTFAGITVASGGNAQQDGCFLVKASAGKASVEKASGVAGYGGFEGGVGSQCAQSANTPGIGDGSLGHCEGTTVGTATDGGGGHVNWVNGSYKAWASGGGGYGGGGAYTKCGTGQESFGGAGSGAIIITCPDGYIPEFVVWNTIDGVTEWRRDENIFNDFGETA